MSSSLEGRLILLLKANVFEFAARRVENYLKSRAFLDNELGKRALEKKKKNGGFLLDYDICFVLRRVRKILF